MRILSSVLAAVLPVAGCSTYPPASLSEGEGSRQAVVTGLRLSSRAAEEGKGRRLTRAQIQSRKRAAAQKDHLVLGSWEAANFIPLAHQGAFGAVLVAKKDGEAMVPRFNEKHIAGREELSMSSFEKTLESGAVLDIDMTQLAGHSGEDLVLHHDAAIGRTTGRRPGEAGEALPRMADISLSELPRYGIHLKGGGYADILTFRDFIERFPTEAFSVETKTRTAAVNLVKFVHGLPGAEQRTFLNRAILYAIARPGDESGLGAKLAMAEPTKILRDGLGDAAVIASSAEETTAFTMAYGIPGLSWAVRLTRRGPPLTLEGDVLGAPATGFREVQSLGKIPFVRRTRTISRRMMEEAHKQGVMVLPWTIDKKRALNRAVRIGADGAYSNDPRILDELIREMGDTVEPVVSRTGL